MDGWIDKDTTTLRQYGKFLLLWRWSQLTLINCFVMSSNIRHLTFSSTHFCPSWLNVTKVTIFPSFASVFPTSLVSGCFFSKTQCRASGAHWKTENFYIMSVKITNDYIDFFWSPINQYKLWSGFDYWNEDWTFCGLIAAVDIETNCPFCFYLHNKLVVTMCSPSQYNRPLILWS